MLMHWLISKPIGFGVLTVNTVEHFIPLFITLGAAKSADAAPDTLIDGYFMGLSKRSFAAI